MELMARKHSLHNVFRDFTTLAACTISNSVDKTQFEEREERYMRTISKYNKEEANKFAKILELVTTGLSGARYGDFLGELFMKLEISNKNSGDRKSTRLNSSHVSISYAVFCLKKKKIINIDT